MSISEDRLSEQIKENKVLVAILFSFFIFISLLNVCCFVVGFWQSARNRGGVIVYVNDKVFDERGDESPRGGRPLPG
ncbi:putative protein V3 [Apiscitlodal virus]